MGPTGRWRYRADIALTERRRSDGTPSCTAGGPLLPMLTGMASGDGGGIPPPEGEQREPLDCLEPREEPLEPPWGRAQFGEARPAAAVVRLGSGPARINVWGTELDRRVGCGGEAVVPPLGRLLGDGVMGKGTAGRRSIPGDPARGGRPCSVAA